MCAEVLIAWYRGRHALRDFGRDSYRLTLVVLIVAIMTMIANYGAWLHPFSPNEAGPASSGSSVNSSQPVATQAVDFALSQIGSPYVWGATGPYYNGYDSGGFVMAAWAHAGVSIPRTSPQQWEELPHVAKNDIHPGDLLFYEDMGHVAMYVGHNEIIDAPMTGESVRVIPMSTYGDFEGAVQP